MRPVLLEMNGFAAFREPATVDFTGADYFVLVGPTGAGKSTVLDAVTFALYGSVPRWDNQRTVALALAPTAGRGAVRFVFDVGGQRYVVARELRRAGGSGAVSVRNARLERLLDPAGMGGVEEETEPIADGAAATTDAVQQLLGMPFADFCTCVVLPQGDFAEFLHAEPRKRQEKLVRILGLGLYEVVARAANSEAAEAKLRAEVLGTQLADYADATAEAERAAAERVAALDGLAARTAAALPELAAATAGQQAAAEQLRRVHAEQRLLRVLTVPDGVDRLHERDRATAVAVRVARERVSTAERGDGSARAELAAAPARERLEQLRREHAELAAGLAELPGLTERAEKALADYELAVQDAADAQAALDGVRGHRDAAAGALAAAQEQVRRLVAERAAFLGVRVPVGLAELDERRVATRDALRRADAGLAAAEAADTGARFELAAAPPRGPLEQARRDLRAVREADARRRRTITALAAAERDRAAAVAAVAATRHRWDHAQAEQAQRQRANLAAALRSTLEAGADCPVCDQLVPARPAALPAADLAAAERAVATSGRAHEDAREAAAAAEAACRRTGEMLAELAETARRLWSGLVDALAGLVAGQPPGEPAALYERLAQGLAAAGAGVTVSRVTAASVSGGVPRNTGGTAPDESAPDESAPDEPAAPTDDAAVDAVDTAVQDVLAELDRLTLRVTATDAALRAARRDRAAAAGAATAAREELASAAAALRVARDPLVPFGAPAAPDDELLAGWTTLVTWARTEATAREHALPPARAAATAAETAVEAAGQQLRSAERAVRDRRADETAAARTEQEARDVVATLERRIAQLRTALADARTDAEAAAELTRRDRLEAAATAADTELRAARAELRSAERAAAEVAREVGAGWQALRAARDPLVPLNAPALPDDDLQAAWSTLIDWARTRISVAVDQQTAAEQAARAADRDRLAVEQRIAADLTDHGVEVVGELAEAARPAVAAAAERAHGGRQRLTERRATAARLAADRDAAESAQQVARMLGGLLRSDGFPRWLVGSALDALVADASASLIELSGGQFELTHAGGEFQVVDHADADARRPVKTLSGGETFQASLALALALSAQLSGLAAAGAPRLESIFLDEGFGSLDEANLEIVASTLENLAARGDRVVGLITHVPALAERVPVRYVVSRDERTASVVRENL